MSKCAHCNGEGGSVDSDGLSAEACKNCGGSGVCNKLSEKLLDDRIVKLVKSLGGNAMKLTSLSFTGMPDRTVLLPGGNICFVEVKSTGKKPSARQELVIGWLRTLGFTVFVVSDEDSYQNFRNYVISLTL